MGGQESCLSGSGGLEDERASYPLFGSAVIRHSCDEMSYRTALLQKMIIAWAYPSILVNLLISATTPAMFQNPKKKKKKQSFQKFHSIIPNFGNSQMTDSNGAENPT